MPMPGSQELESIDLAYFLHAYRWFFRIGLGALALLLFFRAPWKRRWLPALGLVLGGVVAYMCNFQMAADTMFYQPTQVRLEGFANNKVDSSRLILGVEVNGMAKAYPIQYLGYHHQVIDEIRGEKVMVTYCTVCRTGRVYEPRVKGKTETFRLVGMDHFNAMFEDKTTGSWWRQVTGEAIAGPLKGQVLPEIPSRQMSLGQWLRLHPESLVMQADPTFQVQYDSMSVYETRGKSSLTKTDTLSWKRKSWVLGVKIGPKSKAYDWNRLKKERVINDVLNDKPILLALAKDGKSFVAFERPAIDAVFSIKGDTLLTGDFAFDLSGKMLTSSKIALKPVQVYQEFWHSWQTFNPETERY